MQSPAKTIPEYLSRLPEERRVALEAVRKVIMQNLPEGYEETMQYGMIAYVVPLSLYPAGYLGKKDVPLPYAALASQKNHMAIYLMSLYPERDQKGLSWFQAAYAESGKKLDMGRSCIRFKKLDDLPLDVIGKAVALTPVSETIKTYEAVRKRN